MPFYNLKGKM